VVGTWRISFKDRRAYLRSLNPVKLASQVEVEVLNDEEELDEATLRVDTPLTTDVSTTYGGLPTSQLTDTDAPFEWKNRVHMNRKCTTSGVEMASIQLILCLQATASPI
jgi:hypothetical protein